MFVAFDTEIEEMLARGGTFDITGTSTVNDKQFWGFSASDGAVIEAIKGVPLKTEIETLAEIRSAEVDVSALLVTSLVAGLLSNTLYRVDGYIITSVKLTSGSIHAYKSVNQISA